MFLQKALSDQHSKCLGKCRGGFMCSGVYLIHERLLMQIVNSNAKQKEK